MAFWGLNFVMSYAYNHKIKPKKLLSPKNGYACIDILNVSVHLF